MSASRTLCVLVLLMFLSHCAAAVERHYYIAAVNINWDYTSDGHLRTGPSYKKAVYREYDAGFTQPKTHPSSSGLLGPTLRGQEGDTITVTFKNMADHPCSIHPHGIAYGKQSEGALYFDNTSLFEKEDDVILPGHEHTYQWEVTSEVTPTAADPPCLTYTYISHYDIVRDFNTGLIGAMLICKKGSLDDSGRQLDFHQESVLLFGVFDESRSWYGSREPPGAQQVKHTINGYTNGSVPGLSICTFSKVSWHLLAMSSEPELFSVHFNGQVLEHGGHKTSAIGIIAGTATSAIMSAIHPGRWLVSSHISRHLEAGLHGYVNIETCENFSAPKRRLTIQQKQESQEWTFYIAAEEFVWDYAPNMPGNMDGSFRSKYFKQGPQRIGKRYKKAVFTQYKDGTFKERAEEKQRKMELGILGPVIRAQIRDVIKIVFRNKASRPYSIYPHGLTIDKAAEGASYPDGGNQTHRVQPGDTYTYVWSVTEENVPSDSDPRCLTRMYHSAVDTPRDIASGLVGPLLICKSQSLNKKNVQLKADKEQQAMFAVFDENKSWYHDENIQTYCSEPHKVQKEDPEFYKSNVMHTINGYMYESGQDLGFCNGEIVTWHVSSVGQQDYIQTATFYGHTFELKNREEDVLSLFPMTGETITMNMLNIGIWLLASLNSHDSNKGMRVKFKDLECFRDYVMEYDYESPEFKVWIPQPVEETKKEIKPIAPKEVDKQSDYYADVLGFSRSARSIADEAELSFLDHDDGLFPTVVEEKRIEDEIKNASLNFNLTISETLDLEEAEPSREGLNKTTEESLEATDVYFNVVKTSNASRNHSLDFDLDGTQTANRTGNASEVEGNFTMAKQSPNQTSANTADSPETLQTRASEVADDDHNGSVEAFTYTVLGSGSPHTSSEAQAEEVFVLLDGGRLTDISTDNETSEEHDLPQTQSEIISQELSGNTGEGTGNETGSQELNSTRGNYTEMDWQTNSEAESTSDANVTNETHQRNELELSNKTSESSPEPPMNASKLQEHMENIINPLGKNNNSFMSNSSEDKSEESREEVVIYLMGNQSEAIITSHLDLTENWGYDGKHEVVSMKIPDQIYKYVTDGPEATPNATKSEKKKKIVHHRVKPSKGLGMKTKKRKDYKPQPRSALSSKGLSPRGFGPPAFGPRGARPVSSEEDIMGEAIVIGVPRRDFKNYDLYLPKHEKDSGFDGTVSEEYEYVEYKDPYGKKDSTAMDATAQHFLKLSEDQNTRTYFISAEEEEWDYAGYGQRRLDKTSLSERSTSFKKVLFRKYLDSTFTVRDIRGEMDEHLGILGPVIKAEVDQTIMIFFRNRASRPFSLHANGVHYLKQMEGLSYDDQSPYWYKQDDAVQPNSSYVYMWTANPKSGPKNGESDCRTWTYYSAVNPERDINSGLIGPLLVCRKGTLKKEAADRREFVLLFMSFDENKSWYYDENRERIERKNKRAVVDPNFQQNLKFEAINGIIYSLKGLRMYTNQLAKWHLINMGSTKDLHSVHFHGQTFINKDLKDHRQGVYPLLPGGFATLEMFPSKPGLWQLESEVGLSQQRGMQTLFLVLDNMCDHPLGLTSGTVKDEQITASDHRGQWSPNLARLDNKGKHNAWSTRKPGQHIQVDFQRPVVISKVVTQGAKQFMKSHFAVNYTISYSTDKKKWIFYKGDSTAVRKTFEGNSEAHEKKENIFFPPLIGRYVRLHPLHSYNFPTIRMEYYGCELDGCSVPLGMQSGRIKDGQITASSVASSWYTGHWHPWYARLNKQGTTNAWQAKNHDMQQWIQVVLSDVKKITGIITQGAKSLGSEMFVTAYTLEYSDDGKFWTKYTDDEDYEEKTFQGNTDNNGQVKNYIYPPIFSRYLRIIPKRWQGAMTMRMELLGCDFE